MNVVKDLLFLINIGLSSMFALSKSRCFLCHGKLFVEKIVQISVSASKCIWLTGRFSFRRVFVKTVPATDV